MPSTSSHKMNFTRPMVVCWDGVGKCKQHEKPMLEDVTARQERSERFTWTFSHFYCTIHRDLQPLPKASLSHKMRYIDRTSPFKTTVSLLFTKQSTKHTSIQYINKNNPLCIVPRVLSLYLQSSFSLLPQPHGSQCVTDVSGMKITLSNTQTNWHFKNVWSTVGQYGMDAFQNKPKLCEHVDWMFSVFSKDSCAL